MDTWLSNLTVSAPKATLNDVRTQAQVIAAKPATAFDLCYLTATPRFRTRSRHGGMRCRPEADESTLRRARSPEAHCGERL